jgi:hypothetical protein
MSAEPPIDISSLCVLITITCKCGAVIEEYTDRFEEKYPFWCDGCDEDMRTQKYPWSLNTKIVSRPPVTAQPETELGTG